MCSLLSIPKWKQVRNVLILKSKQANKIEGKMFIVLSIFEYTFNFSFNVLVNHYKASLSLRRLAAS